MTTPHRIRHRALGVLAAAGLLLAASAGAAQQSPSPATSGQSTNLGTLVVAPKNSPKGDTQSKGVRIRRSSLKLNVSPGGGSGTAPPSSPKPVRSTPPRPLHIVPPSYPAKAVARGTTGSVKVGFQVDKDGSTSHIHIIKATPAGVFDAAARRAVKQWRFHPATRGGHPVATRVNQTISFNPPPGSAPPAKPTPTKPAHPPKHTAATRKPPANHVPGNVQPVHIVSPNYPSSAYHSNEGGRVTVRFVVRPNGHTGNIHVIAARPSGVFNRAAINAVRQWRFRPVSKPTVVVQTITFNPPGH